MDVKYYRACLRRLLATACRRGPSVARAARLPSSGILFGFYLWDQTRGSYFSDGFRNSTRICGCVQWLNRVLDASYGLNLRFKLIYAKNVFTCEDVDMLYVCVSRILYDLVEKGAQARTFHTASNNRVTRWRARPEKVGPDSNYLTGTVLQPNRYSVWPLKLCTCSAPVLACVIPISGNM